MTTYSTFNEENITLWGSRLRPMEPENNQQKLFKRFQ